MRLLEVLQMISNFVGTYIRSCSGDNIVIEIRNRRQNNKTIVITEDNGEVSQILFEDTPYINSDAKGGSILLVDDLDMDPNTVKEAITILYDSPTMELTLFQRTCDFLEFLEDEIEPFLELNGYKPSFLKSSFTSSNGKNTIKGSLIHSRSYNSKKGQQIRAQVDILSKCFEFHYLSKNIKYQYGDDLEKLKEDLNSLCMMNSEE